MKESDLKVTYLGQCCFLIECEGCRIVTDPYLSNALDVKYANGPIKWQRAYEPPCRLIDCKPDLILISHAHDDHLDPVTLSEYRSNGGNCTIAAPLPEISKIQSLGFTKAIDAKAENTFMHKGVAITPIACAHTSLDMDEEGHFRNLSYCIDFGSACVFFGGDMSIYDGLYERIVLENSTVLLLPCNGRDAKRTARGIIGNTTAEEAATFAARLGTPFIPCHHDLYAVNGRSNDDIKSAADSIGADVHILAPGTSYTFSDDDDWNDSEI